MSEQAVPRFKVHYQQGSDARRRKVLRAQRRKDGEIKQPRRAWKSGRTTYFYTENDPVQFDEAKSLWAKVAEQVGVSSL